jgi:hypothetical protein
LYSGLRNTAAESSYSTLPSACQDHLQ